MRGWMVRAFDHTGGIGGGDSLEKFLNSLGGFWRLGVGGCRALAWTAAVACARIAALRHCPPSVPHLASTPAAAAAPSAGGGAGSATFRGKRESGMENPYSCVVLAGARSMDERRMALQVRSVAWGGAGVG